MKTYEVEVKHRVADFDSIQSQLMELGADALPVDFQCDTYFQHPSRSFKDTDEALRIRQSTAGLFVTYKGPKIDQETKTRHEIEFSIGETEKDKAQFSELLTALGFSVAANVEKTRREFKLKREDRLFKIALDSVAGIGCFVELETECSESLLDESREAVKHLAEELGLCESIRVSYLEMVLSSGQKD